jgi:hypothetical protein
MLIQVIPKLPMRLKSQTKSYYIGQLGFLEMADYGDYLLLEKEGIEIHFFEFKALDPLENYGQIYIRTNQIEALYAQLQEANVVIHPNAPLQQKPWGQIEFSLLDPDNNLITFGQADTPNENNPEE